MSFNRSSTAMLAAMFLAATSVPIFAQSDPPQEKATTGEANEAWTKPEINSPPPTPNGGMSSGTHKGNELPTRPGISAGDQGMSEQSEENLNRTPSGSR